MHCAHSHWGSARYSQSALPKDHLAAAWFLQRRAKRRHYCTHEWRCAGSREFDHGFAGDAFQKPGTHRGLFCNTHLYILATHPVHTGHCAHHGMVYGTCGPQAEAGLGEGAGPVERHDEPGGRDIGRTAHHQGVLCRGKDEPAFRPCELGLSQRPDACEHTTVIGSSHERVPWHGDDCHRALVRWHTGTQQPGHHRPHLYLLYGDTLQHHQSAKRILKGRL